MTFGSVMIGLLIFVAIGMPKTFGRTIAEIVIAYRRALEEEK